MKDDLIFEEKVSSARTEALFITLTLIFFILLIWRVTTGSPGGLAVILFFLFVLFLFYSLNYRTLLIRLSPDSLKLTFGIFAWTVPMENIEECRLDDLPWLMRLGGAGIHFMFIRKRYRASFNFLEHPRVVITLKKKAGPVGDISFSTRQPEKVLMFIRESVSAHMVTPHRNSDVKPG